MSGYSINNMNFERWMELANRDPQKFEQLRHAKIASVINKTSGKCQQRLLGLQWRIDKIREQYKNSDIAACLAISELMWEAFDQLADLLQQQADGCFPSTAPAIPSNIILFPSQKERKIKSSNCD